jgi:uncharacterized membrane protein (UPF0127 family)
MRCPNFFVALTVVLAVSAQAPVPTPPATMSDECPAPANATAHFLAAAAFAVRAPRGELSLVPVDDEPARERGLMCVVRIPPGKGMIFVFVPPDRPQAFWMKNTLVALDMVFVTAAGRVTSVAADVPATRNGTPDDAVARRGGFGRFVIELGAGDAARHGVVRGTKLALPALTAQQ